MAIRSPTTAPRRSAPAPAREVETTPRRRNAATQAEIDRKISQFVKSIEWELRVPGQHDGDGFSNQKLLEYLALQGRDFAKDTPTLRRFALAEVAAAVAGLGRLPTAAELKRAFSDAAVAFVVRRFDYKVRDIRIPLLTLAYAKAKRKAGFLGPVGIRTGELRDTIEERARAVITG
ncbi:hypothetical protein D4Q85_01120 [bacterium]|nr:MAG: hypothetical protein D4Q85_01120 [bacterium]